MAHVDLNPIRARMADKPPESSDHTSAKRRIQGFEDASRQPAMLMPFVGNPRVPMPEGLPFHLTDRLSLWRILPLCSSTITPETSRAFIGHSIQAYSA